MIEIKNIQGSVIYSTDINRGAKRKFTLMKEDYVTLPFSLEEPKSFPIGSYAEIDGTRFEIVELQKPTLNNSTGGYDYQLRLDAYYWKWKNKIFKFTPEVGGQEASWSLTASLDVHLGIFLRNLEALGYTYEGIGFSFSIDATVENKALALTYENMNMIDALSAMAEAAECEWWVKGNMIYFGRCEQGEYTDFEIGVNVAEMSSTASQSSYATRLYVFGSTRNIPSNYRPIDNNIVANGVVQRRLMLPEGIPYIDAYENMPEEEAIEEVVILDDVYPKTDGNISHVETYDSTVENEDGTTTTETFYRFKDDGITFSNDYILEGEELKVVFTSGSLNGMEFGLVFNPNGAAEKLEDGSWNSEAQLFEIVANEDYGRKLPDATLNPKVGDKYILIGWDSTKIADLGLLSKAEQELYNRGLEISAKRKIDPNTYNCKMFSDYMFGLDNEGQQNPSFEKRFDIGDRVNLVNSAYFQDGRESRIIGFEYNLDFPFDSPIYTIGETAAYSRLGNIESKLNAITLKGQTYTGGNGGVDANKFLRKDKDDRSKGKIASDKAIEVGKFVAGASGAIIQVDKESGQTIAEIDKLYVRMKAYFETLEIINVNSVGGKMILSPVGSITCLDVEETEDAYRCYFLGEQDGEIIENRFEVDDQAFSQMFNAKKGVENKVSNHYYWRLVTAVSRDVVEHNNKKCHYIDLSKTDCDVDSNVPKAGDVINHRGNRSNRDRQNFIEFSSVGTNAPYINLFQGVNSYSLEGKDYVSYGYDQSTGQAYMNVYGRMFIGNRDESSFLRYTPENGLEIKGKLSVGSTYDGKEIGELFNAQKEDLEKFNESVTKEFENLRNELDGVIDTWFGEGEPTLDNYPSVDWVTDSDKDSHLGDLYYSEAGKAYRFQYTPEKGYHWTPIEDSDVVKALEAAKKAQDTADGKRRVFLEQPFPPYDMGDLWAGGADKPLMRCINSRESGSFFETDWALADDTHAYADAINEKLGGAIRGLEYLKKALGEETTVSGGLVLTSQIRLGYTDGVGYRVMAGTNGVLDEDLDGKSIAFWAGGDMSDIENGGSASNAAKYLVRMDGSGYAAGGNLSWDKDGNISVDLNAFFAGKEDGELLVELQDNRYLRKDKDDSTPYGLTVGGKLRLNGTLGFGEKTISKFIRYADSDHESTDAGIYSSLMVDKLIEGEMELLTNKFIRKDMDDSTPYTLGVQSLLIKDKRINNMIRYYDEEKPESSDVDIYSALMIDNLIKDELKVVDDKYLKRKEEDSAEKHIEFQEGITVWQLAKMMNIEVAELATIAEAAVDILRSSKFVDGFFGEGYQIWKSIATGDWNMTIDRLTVRKMMIIYELIIQKIRAVGGMIVASAGNGKVKDVTREGLEYKMTFEDINTFVVNDLIRCQTWTGANTKYYWVEVVRVEGDAIYTRIADYGGAVPEVGDDVVLMGNTKNRLRQGLVLISAAEDGQPRVDVLDGVNTTNLDNCLKARVGGLDGIRDSRFPSDMQPQGYGLYGNNCYLTGVFVLSNGVDVKTQFAILEGMIRANMSSIQQQINAEDNYLGNASLTNDLNGWEFYNDVKVFLTSGGLLHFNGDFYSEKDAFAGIVPSGEKSVLRIKNSFIRQRNKDFSMYPTFDLIEQTTTDAEGNEVGSGVELYRPRMFYVSFRYMVTKRGTLRVYFENEETRTDFEEYTKIYFERTLEAGASFSVMDDIAGKWNGTGDFFLSFDGDIYIYDLALSDNAIADMEERWEMQLEITEKKIQANAEHIKQQGEDLEEYRSEFLFTTDQLRTEFTQLVKDTEEDIIEEYTGVITQTAQKLESDYTAKIGDNYGTITEEYNSKITQTAKDITAELTAKIDATDESIGDLEKGLKADYTAKISASAESLTSDYNAQITNLKNGDIAEMKSSITQNAANIETKVSNSRFDSLSGRVSRSEALISQQADAIALRVKTSDYNGDTIVSYINQTATTVTINASKINLQGKVTVSMLASDTVTKIDSKATQSDITASITEFKNGLGDLAYKNSISATSGLITGLGSLALASVVEVANLGTTVIENGKIKTSLINASALTLSGSQITGLGSLAYKNSLSYSDVGLKSWVAAADIVTAMKGETTAIGGFIQTELIAADLIVVNKLKATSGGYTYSLDAKGFEIRDTDGGLFSSFKYNTVTLGPSSLQTVVQPGSVVVKSNLTTKVDINSSRILLNGTYLRIESGSNYIRIGIDSDGKGYINSNCM